MLHKRLHQVITLSLLFFALNACNNKREIFKVNYELSGCFGSEQSELIMYKDNMDSMSAELKVNGIIVKRARLNEGHHPLIPLFMKELKQLPDTSKFCTTIESYKVFVDGQTIKKHDYCSGWHGYSRLKYTLFGKD